MGIGRESVESRLAKIESAISDMVASRDEYSLATAFFMSGQATEPSIKSSPVTVSWYATNVTETGS
jgi:hypothetical protein